CDFDGWDNVPEEKVLYVGNHNGMVTFEVVMLFYAWYKKYGLERKALGLAHGVALDNVLFRWICPRIGAIPADPDVADEAMKRGYSLLVYPGGDRESMRTFKERKKIDFFQRKGFIRLALRNGVPIVPIVSVGAAETYVVLHQGEELAKKLGLYDKFRLHGMPINVQSVLFFWCLTTGLFTFFPLLLTPALFASILMPLPAKMSFRLLPKIDVQSLVDKNLSEEENLQQIYDYVVAKMQVVHTEVYDKRKYPIIG
ncbi:MAG: 1-acyl-sn-glycerol-3-phosphate acyltransferase, partial [bacterium]